MECDICLNEWDNKKHIPRILSCGHSICEQCLKAIVLKNNQGNFECPTCRRIQTNLKSLDDIQKLKKNISLMKIYDKVDQHKDNLMSMSFSKSYLDTNNSNYMNTEGNLFQKEINGTNTCYYPLCSLHKNVAIYMSNDTPKKYYCEHCVDELCIEDYSPFPNLSKLNEAKLVSCFEKTKIIRSEIERIEEFLQGYEQNFEINNMSKIDELFDYMNKIIEYNYTTAKTLFSQCKNEQKSRIEKKIKELNSLKDELNLFEKNMLILQKENSKKMLNIEHQSKLNEIFIKLSNYLNYENELNLFQMKVEVNNDMKDTLFEVIQSSYDIDVDFLKMKSGEMPTIKELLSKPTTWQCQCGNFENSINDISCSNCKRYRKLENYDNIIFNPLKITSYEIMQLNSRRKQEIKAFQDLLKAECSNKTTYALDINWFLEWKCFVTNDLTEKYIKNTAKKISDNKIIGVLPPNYISNGKICEKGKNNKYTVKSNLKNKEDYLVVNKLLWDWFVLNYAGGPEVIIYYDKDTDINSPSPSNEYGTTEKKFDPNNTLLNDTIQRIAPISNYNFYTKLSDFKLNNSPIKSESMSYESASQESNRGSKIKSLIDNISIKENNII